MPADEAAELRDALKTLQDESKSGDAHRAETRLERALLTTSAAGIDIDMETSPPPSGGFQRQTTAARPASRFAIRE